MESEKMEKKEIEKKLYEKFESLEFVDVRQEKDSTNWDRRVYVEIGDSLGRIFLVCESDKVDIDESLIKAIEVLNDNFEYYELKTFVDRSKSIELIFLFDSIYE
jgi:hypothetical protein